MQVPKIVPTHFTSFGEWNFCFSLKLRINLIIIVVVVVIFFGILDAGWNYLFVTPDHEAIETKLFFVIELYRLIIPSFVQSWFKRLYTWSWYNILWQGVPRSYYPSLQNCISVCPIWMAACLVWVSVLLLLCFSRYAKCHKWRSYHKCYVISCRLLLP